jgi:hypothetical protein
MTGFQILHSENRSAPGIDKNLCIGVFNGLYAGRMDMRMKDKDVAVIER